MNSYETGRKISKAKSGVSLKAKWIKEGRRLERKKNRKRFKWLKQQFQESWNYDFKFIIERINKAIKKELEE